MTDPIYTEFGRSAACTNLLTVQEWQCLGRACYNGVGWLTVARHHAKRFGGSLVLRANDSLIVFTRRSNGRVTRRTYKQGTWGWA